MIKPKLQNPFNLNNVNNQPMLVLHAQLKRCADSSDYRSECPVCPDGVLPVTRHQKDGSICRFDRCIACGQIVVYLDEGIGPETFRETLEVVEPYKEKGVLN